MAGGRARTSAAELADCTGVGASRWTVPAFSPAQLRLPTISPASCELMHFFALTGNKTKVTVAGAWTQAPYPFPWSSWVTALTSQPALVSLFISSTRMSRLISKRIYLCIC